jgi:hypothetical protein
LNDVPHTLVLVTSDGKELLREHAERADYKHRFVFGEEHKGQLMVRIEDINNSDESIEFPLTVVRVPICYTYHYYSKYSSPCNE